ncbi:MAG: hydrogenase 4 membrane subunit [Campylobacter gracilis]|uniref:NADH-ubiquinone/plastoquinone oxidoreductase chain 4L n=1 Tax=Campylobacter gracilis RM3268 TaxID=553220 RepID=C8PJ81_9BACT|nr:MULTISPECIES: hydrogenase 4 membrane subunit [Campylobacter]AKT92341.1 hydrogenase-4, membrane component E [Campylobacter gracilis]EEV16986.1 NADH-ubiquinone/plastoquinone oxidoreductase chain 4L [Campylobacter gracilis RM3268]MBS6151801.1 hydrogenase 4 membrane subunit [Campylobacter gracilis]UEB45472.1 hydrogenase 4 membrane subunit [Campylobacter gracilis]SUW81861.1 hydrogenase 4 membrane subunit [Campylobacter gracilis]
MNSIDILAICMIVTSLAVFGLRNLKLSIGIYAIQTLLLVSIFFMLYSNFNAPQLRIWAIVAFFTKVIFVPGILFWLVKKLDVISEDEPVGGFFVSPVIAMGFSLAIAMTINPILLQFSLIQERIVLIAAVTVFMMGIFGFMLRNSFIKQILAYCLFENGIHLSLALMAYNSHELVELGILTDAIFAVIIMSVLAVRFYKAYDGLDTSKASNLRG